MIIMVKNKAKAKKLYKSGLCFGGLVKVIEKYWEAESSSICIIDYIIDHEWIKNYQDWSAKFIICSDPYKIEKY